MRFFILVVALEMILPLTLAYFMARDNARKEIVNNGHFCEFNKDEQLHCYKLVKEGP